MNRRNFTTALCTLLSTGPLIYSQNSVRMFANPMDRIGMSTVNFRRRFKSTAKVIEGKELTLLDIPAYFKTRFKIKNLEFWSRHFESTEDEYLKRLKKSIKKAGCKLINIQMDEKYQIGDIDPIKRKESLELAMHWVEVANKLGSKCIRINPGKGQLDYIIDSYKVINEKAKQYGIILMVENHFGIEMDINIHLKIINEIGKNTYALPDFGNYSEDVRYDAIKKLMPYTYQVSAKTADFDSQMNHTAYDFDKCMEIASNSGFKGIYSIEQWSRNETTLSDEAIADWMIKKVLPYCR
jgi:sugar phosphate isomerase/epimerase